MEANELKKEYDEWVRKIRLAHYKRLSTALSLDSEDKNMLVIFRQLLLDDGFTDDVLAQEVLQYKELSDEEKKKQIDDKAQELVDKIMSYLENNEEISSKVEPELYHRIQELLALDPKGANKLIDEFFEREEIYRCTVCGDSLFGGPCTYYFSKKPYLNKN